MRSFLWQRALWLAAVLCALQGLHLGVAAQAVRWQPTEAELQAMRASVEARYQRDFPQGRLRERASLVGTAGLALDALASGSARSGQILGAFASQMDQNPSSPTFGNIRWYQGDPKVVDPNGIEFVTRQLVLAWVLYSDQLAPPQREALQQVLTTAKTGVPRHRVPITYTNIWLMKTWNVIALGEGLGDDALAQQGYAMLRDWLAHTRRTGINEYLSPSYYDVDLESLALVANLSRDAQARQHAREALDIFWHDIALNWYAPSQRLGGTHSRDYNRLFNQGGVNEWVNRAGWSSTPWTAVPGPYASVAWAPPPASAQRWLQGPFPRQVSARWGEAPEKRYTHYLGRNFSIASAEAGYPSGHDNSPLVINLGAGADTPIINFFMDGRRDHYGQNRTLEAGSGHMKALHMRPFLSSVQRDNAVLFAATVRENKPEYSALESVVTLPADAQYWLNDTRLNIFTHRSRWTWDPMPNGESTAIDLRQENGQHTLLLRDADPRQGVGVSQTFAVEAGEDYRLQARLQGGEVYLYLNFLDANKKLIGSERALRVRGGDSAFVQRELQMRAPPGAVWCKAWLYSTTANQTELRATQLQFERVGPRAEVLGPFDLRAHQPQAIAVPAGATLFVRRGDAVAALRLLGAWDVDGQAIGMTLHNDGLAWGALRLTAQHAAAATDLPASIAMWAWAGEGLQDEAAFAAQRVQILAMPATATLRSAMLQATQGELALTIDTFRPRLVTRRGHSAVPESAWSVDGQPWQP